MDGIRGRDRPGVLRRLQPFASGPEKALWQVTLHVNNGQQIHIPAVDIIDDAVAADMHLSEARVLQFWNEVADQRMFVEYGRCHEETFNLKLGEPG